MALGFSLLFWLLGMGGYILAVLFLAIFQMEVTYAHANPDFMCQVSFWLLPQGVGPWCGICSAAAFLLQGHFITLVKEAVASLRAAAGPAADPRLLLQSAPALVVVDPSVLQAYKPVSGQASAEPAAAAPETVAVAYAIRPPAAGSSPPYGPPSGAVASAGKPPAAAARNGGSSPLPLPLPHLDAPKPASAMLRQ